MLASIDLETTGINPEQDQILEIGVVLDDLTEENLTPINRLPQFHCYVRHEQIKGSPKALTMNQRILETLAEESGPEGPLILNPCQAIQYLQKFLSKHVDKATAAGKNLANFDFPFLDRLSDDETVGGKHYRNFFHHRILDIGSVYYDPAKDGNKLPNLQTCFDRAGLGKNVDHTALGDAQDVLRLLRIKYRGKEV